MSVYVDDMAAPFGRMLMCHMLADTTEELLEMADKIGLQRKWIQHAGTHREHFDIGRAKKELAIQHGAKAVTMGELGRILLKKRNDETMLQSGKLFNE